jgi:carbon-monoxide dehydrogenase medium subunit
MWDEYLIPKSVEEVLHILRSREGNARIMAGGTDLVPEIKSGAKKAGCLVDISEIDLLKKIELDGELIKIGAGVTHADVASSELIRKQATLLAEAASAVGSPLIRNQGTIVGNVVNAQPAADAAVALFALDARIEICSASGVRVVPIESVYQGVGVSKVDGASEIVTALYFKGLRSNQGSAFVRLAQRKALALPMLNVAAVTTITDGRFEEARVAIGPVAPMPFRARGAEALLKGADTGQQSIDRAADAAASEARPRDSALRGSAEYRREMVRVFVRRALERAVQRAQQE